MSNFIAVLQKLPTNCSLSLRRYMSTIRNTIRHLRTPLFYIAGNFYTLTRWLKFLFGWYLYFVNSVMKFVRKKILCFVWFIWLTQCTLLLSAGVGRTGSFCCIYSAIREIEGQNNLSKYSYNCSTVFMKKTVSFHLHGLNSLLFVSWPTF